MAKYIAHAAISENGAIYGNAGDQTGKEVCLQEWYQHAKKWDYVLRIDHELVRKQFANNMIDIANNNAVGYCQSGRNSLLTEAIKVNFDFTKIKTLCECDCSSAVAVCLLGAIYVVLGKAAYDKAYKILFAGSNCATTRSLRSCINSLKNNGILATTAYNASAYTTGTSKAIFGDIYLKEGYHVVVYIDNGNKSTTNTSTSKTIIGTATAKQTMTVRNKHNIIGKALGYISKGSKVEVLEIMSNGWYKIVWKDSYGYTSNAGNLYYTYTARTAAPTAAQTNAPTVTSGNTTTVNSSSTTVKAGEVFTLKNTPIYQSETGKSTGTKSGTFYAWDATIKNGRIRITNKPSRVGVKGQVTCWIDVASVKQKQYIYDNVDYAKVFDPVYYSNKYSDLKKAFGTDENKLFNHFVNYGMKESRQAISTFNVVAYKNYYVDLQKAFGTNMPKYYWHYCVQGYKENRKTV